MTVQGNRKWSALDPATAFDGTEKLSVVQSGANVRTTLEDIATFASRQVVTLNYFDYLPAAKVAGIAAGTDTTTDQSTYWQAFRDALAAISAAGKVPHGVIPQCVIRTSTAPNFAIMYLQLETQGMPRIIATAAVSGFKVDGTGLGPGTFGVRFMRVGPLIASTTTGTDGIYIKKVHQSEFLGLLNLGAVTNGIQVNGCVSTIFEKASCTAQPEAFLTTPAIGLLVDGGVGTETSWCSFYMPIFEYVPIGVQLDHAFGNSFFGGVAEGCTNIGVKIKPLANFNKFYGMDLEANTTNDFYCEGARNDFFSVDSGGTSLFTSATCFENHIFGGHFLNLTFDALSSVNLTDGASVTTLTDPTTGQTANRYSNCMTPAGTWLKDWTTFATVITSGTGSITTKTGALKSVLDGNTVHFDLNVTITNNGTGATTVIATMPYAAARLTAFAGQEPGSTFKGVCGYMLASTSSLVMTFYDGTYPGGVGSNVIAITGTYQRA